MMEGGFYQQKRLSPTGIAMVVLLHGAAITALLTAKGIQVMNHRDPPIVVKPIPLPPPPPPTANPKPQPQHRSTIDIVHPVVPIPNPPPLRPIDLTRTDIPPISWTPPGPIDVAPHPPPPPIHEPVRVPPRIDPNSALQPPYPASAQREGAEGTVQVRVEIGPDGRVSSVEKLGSGRDDFFAATERQALRYWRFKPATVDGKPVESSKVMTVHFRLDDLG